MSILQTELDSFHQFATSALVRGCRDVSLEDLLRQWRDEQEAMETVASVRRGVDDVEAGRVRSLTEVDVSIRQELGFPAHGS